MKSELSSKFTGWLAGFWEGDGLFEIRGDRMVARFTDSDNLDIHRYIYKVLSRGEYGDGLGLRLYGEDCVYLISLISNSLVSPKRLDKINRWGCKELESLLPIKQSTPTLDWLVGNWDANGSSCSDDSYPVKISISSSDEALLSILKDTFGGNYNKSSGNFPRWRMFPSVTERNRFLSIAKYLVENAKKEDKRLRLEERLNTYLSLLEGKELCLEK